MRSPDPLNSARDELYAIYRKGLITRHITANGRYMDKLALEIADDRLEPDVRSGSHHVCVTHSTRIGRLGPRVVTKTPIDNVRYAFEIEPGLPREDGKYQSREHLWVPLLLPVKYPGLQDHDIVEVRRGPSPWWPQAPARLRGELPKAFFAPVGTADNPLYYGGMALAALAMESIHGVSPHSIKYARMLVQGIRQHEMNGWNGYLIRQSRWLVPPLETEDTLLGSRVVRWAKHIRGASSEELLGALLGLAFYIRAEGADVPLRAAAQELRDRVLAAVARGWSWENYAHPFMDDTFWVRHYEYALNASAGIERGSDDLFMATLFGSMAGPLLVEDRMQNIVMALYAMLLVLCGGFSESAKAVWAMMFLNVLKVGLDSNREALKGNALFATVALLANSFLNPQRDCLYLGDLFRGIWTSELETSFISVPGLPVADFEELITVARDLVFDCTSHNNEDATPGVTYRAQWQHNLPLGSLDDDDIPPGVTWQPRNPHQRLGGFWEWKTTYPQWWHMSHWNYGDYQGWNHALLRGMTENEYFWSPARRYQTVVNWTEGGFAPGLEQREVRDNRGHGEVQLEGAAGSLLFLRMLLTDMTPSAFPAPRLPDADTFYPPLPLPGVRPLDPMFLSHTHQYRGKWDDWVIGGDREKAIGVISFSANVNTFPSHLVITATADPSDDALYLDSWRLGTQGFEHLRGAYVGVFDEVVLAKTSDVHPTLPDLLVVALRAEHKRVAFDDHWLELRVYKVYEGGYLELLKSVAASSVGAGAAKEIDLCVLARRFACVTFKTRNDRARLKIYDLDSADLAEWASIPAEYSSGAYDTPQIGRHVIVESAWSDVVVNGYQTSPPYSDLVLFGRNIGDLGSPSRAEVPAKDGWPVATTTVRVRGKYYLVTATHDEFPELGTRFTSFEVQRDGRLVQRGSFMPDPVEADSLFLRSSGPFERMRMSRIRSGDDEAFVLAGKARVGNGDGLVLLYGEVTADGTPTIRDWNCLGSGDDDGVQKVDICGDASNPAGKGVVTVRQDRNDNLEMSFWRHGIDFDWATGPIDATETALPNVGLLNYRFTRWINDSAPDGRDGND